jgi:hypothetical protein
LKFVREHYIKLQKEGRKVETMGVFAKAYDECAIPVQ